MRLEPWHVVVLIILVVLLFGANRLPSLAKSVGQSLKIFKSEINDLSADNKPADVKKDETTDDSTGTKA